MSLFFVADRKVLDDDKLSSNDKVIYYKLVSYMNRHTGSCFPRHATISKAIGLSRSTIYRSILHLAKLGYVKVTRKSSTNEYHLPKQTILEKTLLFCYSYNPDENSYALKAIRVMQITGTLFAFLILLVIITMIKKESNIEKE